MSQLKLAIKDTWRNAKFKWQNLDRGVHVLTFHGLIEKRNYPRLQRNFETVDEFYAKIKQLKKGKGVVLSPLEFEAQYQDKSLFKNRKAFLLTFDDGYKNNLKAMEILADFGYKAAYFVTSSAIGSQSSIWTVNLSLLILEGNLAQIEYENQHWPLRTEIERKDAFNAIRYGLKVAVGSTRETEMAKIIAQFPDGELERLMDKHAYFKMLTKTELATVAADGQCIQSHGAAHELFHQNQADEVVFDELKKSKSALEKIINKPVTWYAYPNGDDKHPKVGEYLKKTGYSLGFSLGEKPFSAQPNFIIPRYNAREHSIKFLF